MIIVKATMYPAGVPRGTYEVLCARIVNVTPHYVSQDDLQEYSATVIQRPSSRDAIRGFEADVRLRNHDPRQGFIPLLVETLTRSCGGNIVSCPESILLKRLDLVEAESFERRLGCIAPR